MKIKSISAAAVLAVILLTHPAWAGPFSDFEADLQGSYATYRVSLFETNRKDRAATESSLNALHSSWQNLAKRWSASPPPQYADDPDFVPTLSRVDKTIAKAMTETGAGQLAEAHDTLEKIRDELGELRRRNGIVSFSDRMNIYHEQMEKILFERYDGFSATGLGALREDAAILSFAYQQIEHNTPKTLAETAGFMAARNAVKESVSALLAAVRAQDAAQAKAAISALKKPYSLLFLKFG